MNYSSLMVNENKPRKPDTTVVFTWGERNARHNLWGKFHGTITNTNITKQIFHNKVLHLRIFMVYYLTTIKSNEQKAKMGLTTISHRASERSL